MCQALRELFKDEIQEEIHEAETRATDATIIASIKSLMKKFGMDAKTIMDGMSISAADQSRYLTML